MKFIFKKKHFEKKFNLMREQVEPERAADDETDEKRRPEGRHQSRERLKIAAETSHTNHRRRKRVFCGRKCVFVFSHFFSSSNFCLCSCVALSVFDTTFRFPFK